MAKEYFYYGENHEHLKLLDEAARRAGVSRGQAFEDFLEMSVCALSGGTMESQYLAVVKKYAARETGKRGIDSLAELFGRMVSAMEETRDGIKDILGDLFVGGISHGEAGQYFSPMPACQMMAQLTMSELPEVEQAEHKSVCDPACGSGRMLLAVAENHRHWTFVGQDIDRRCVQMCTINLALRNLYGYVLWGNSLGNECKLIYRTGMNLHGGVIREATLAEYLSRFPAEENENPSASQVVEATVPVQSTDTSNAAETTQPPTPTITKQLRLF